MSPDSQLALALVAALDDRALELLAEQLAPLLVERLTLEARPCVYTVASLSEQLGVSERMIRGRIARGELPAVKRGGRWLIAADAVESWAKPSPLNRPAPQRRRTRARTGSLASVIENIDDGENESVVS